MHQPLVACLHAMRCASLPPHRARARCISSAVVGEFASASREKALLAIGAVRNPAKHRKIRPPRGRLEHISVKMCESLRKKLLHGACVLRFPRNSRKSRREEQSWSSFSLKSERATGKKTAPRILFFEII